MNVAYLSSPYNHPDPKIKQQRHDIVNSVVFDYMRRGILVYSPLTHNIPIDQLGIHGNWMTWKDFDHEMVSRCDRVIVLKLPGWEDSKGVAAEIARAKEVGIPIEWIECPENLVTKSTADADSDALKELENRMLAFYEERDWMKFHSPKNLAMNLGVEVGELMEHFRWLTEPQSFVESPEKLTEIQDEIGDVFLGLLHLAQTLRIDLLKAAHEKLSKTAAKYPLEKCKGLSHKYTEYQS